MDIPYWMRGYNHSSVQESDLDQYKTKKDLELLKESTEQVTPNKSQENYNVNSKRTNRMKIGIKILILFFIILRISYARASEDQIYIGGGNYMSNVQKDYVKYQGVNSIVIKRLGEENDERPHIDYYITPTDEDWHFYGWTALDMEMGWDIIADHHDPIHYLILPLTPFKNWRTNLDGSITNGLSRDGLYISFTLNLSLLECTDVKVVETVINETNQVEYYTLTGHLIGNVPKAGQVLIQKRGLNFTRVYFNR